MRNLLISLQDNVDVIGLKSLHYTLLEKGHDSTLLFIPGFNLDDGAALSCFDDFVEDIDPDLIGFSLMSGEYNRSRDLTAHLKAKTGKPVVWGGIHPTIAPEASLEFADYVCLGEGERTIMEIADAVDSGRDLRTVGSLGYLDNGALKTNEMHPVIADLDSLPHYEHVPAGSFVIDKGRLAPVDWGVIARHTRYKGKTYSVISSRGCPFSCTYCCNNFLSRLYESKKIRRRGVEHVISEIEKAVASHPEIEYINFHDDCFLACSTSYLDDFCKAYRERVGKPFIARSIPVYINRDKMKILKESGLSWISLGLQSGSDRVNREVYQRKSLRKDFLEAAEVVKEFDIAAFYDVILDNPFETEAETLETVETLMEVPKPFYPEIFSLSFYYGTDLFERARQECPETIEDTHSKDYLVYRKSAINRLVRLAVFKRKRGMRRLLRLYRRGPDGLRFRMALFLAGLWSSIFIEPLTYFRVIRLSQGKSLWKTLKVLPSYFRKGFEIYLKQFRKGGSNLWLLFLLPFNLQACASLASLDIDGLEFEGLINIDWSIYVSCFG